MLKSLLPYYERELSHLRELSGEFARRYPKVAGRLQLEGDQCADPHTERLIEAFAFLTARVHRKLDDEYPEITDSLMDVMYPHYLRPIPSMTILQFETDAVRSEISRRYTIERHQPVTSPPIGGTLCKFRTCYPVDLYPLVLKEASLARPNASEYLSRIAPDAAAVLTLRLEGPGDKAISGIGLNSLRFFLNGEPALMNLLYELLMSQTIRVRVSDGSDNPARTHELPGTSLAPVGFGRDEGMLEYDNRSFLGYRLLSEYFAFPEKFLFIDFLHLDKVAPILGGNKLVIQCLLRRYPDTARHHRLLETLSANHFKLGCTPVVNLFSKAAEPIRVSYRRDSYQVQADAHRPWAYEVVRIERVARVEKSAGTEKSAEVLPFYALRHGGDLRASPRFYWHASRKQAQRRDDKGTDVELHLVDLNFNTIRPGAEVLSLNILCSNRDLPAQLPFGGGPDATHTDFALPGHSVVKRARLLRKPTPSLRPPTRRGLQWRLISQLSLNYLSLVEEGGGTLQEILALYNFSDSPVTNRQIQGIVTISSKPTVERVDGHDFSGFVRGTEITLTLDEDYYVGGSVYLFASVLDRLFALYCTPNSFIRLRVRTPKQLDEEVVQWPARSGEALVI
jgi:type VI secretion system protein ImpG